MGHGRHEFNFTSGVAYTAICTPAAPGTMSVQIKWLHAAVRFYQAISFLFKGVFKSRVKGRDGEWVFVANMVE